MTIYKLNEIDKMGGENIIGFFIKRDNAKKALLEEYNKYTDEDNRRWIDEDKLVFEVEVDDSDPSDFGTQPLVVGIETIQTED